MPLEVQVYPEGDLLWAVGRGIVSDQDLAAYVRKYLVEEDLRHYDEVFDLRQADLLDLTFQGLSEVAAAAAPTDPEDTPTRIGLLISRTADLGVSRLYQSIREAKGGRRDLRIFGELSELLEWLGLPEGWSPP